jgi:hypothetical protein
MPIATASCSGGATIARVSYATSGGNRQKGGRYKRAAVALISTWPGVYADWCLSKFRHLLVPLTAAWLSMHLLLVTGTAIVAFASGSSDIVCTCVHGADHGLCPMHGTPSDSSRCRLQSTQDDLSTAMLSVLGPLMLPATSNVATIDMASRALIGYSSPSLSDRSVPPDPPLPRS